MDLTERQRQHTTRRHPWELARVNVIQAFIKKYAQSPDHIVDVGSGDAFVLISLCSTGIGQKYTAIDTAYTAEIIDSIKQPDCTIRFLPALPVRTDPAAACVLLMDVLEHCNDDGELLQKTKELTNRNTTLFITVPAFGLLFSKHDELLHHYRRYTAGQIKNLCEGNGYIVLERGYFFCSLLLIRIIQLFLEKTGLRRPEKSIDNWAGNRWVTKAGCALLTIDFWIGRAFSKIGVRLPGLSAFCICRPLP